MGAGGTALTACSRVASSLTGASKSAILPALRQDAKTAAQIQNLIDYYVEYCARLGMTNIAIASGGIGPGMRAGKLFFGGSPVPSSLANLPIENIANYSAGFPHDDEAPVWWHFLDPTTLRKLVKGLAGKSLPQCTPGQYYSYSNFAWGLMGEAAVAVAKESGDPIRHYIKRAYTGYLKWSQ